MIESKYQRSEQEIENLAKFDAYRTALEIISALDPETDSEEGWNEWGEADCFRKAQTIARLVLGTCY